MSMHDLIESLDIDGIQEVVGEQPKLLIVDDDERLLRSLQRVLKGSYDVQAESKPRTCRPRR